MTNAPRPMSPLGNDLFDAFSFPGSGSITLPTSELVIQVKNSLTAHAIAGLLGDLLQAQVGILTEDRLPFLSLLPAKRAELMAIAEHAVKSLDPDWRVACADEAVADIVDWMDGPFDGHAPTTADLARHTIAMFCEKERA